MRIARIFTWFFIGLVGALIVDTLFRFVENPAINLIYGISAFFYTATAIAFSLTANNLERLTPVVMIFFLLLCFTHQGFDSQQMLSVAISYVAGYGAGKLAQSLAGPEQGVEL